MSAILFCCVVACNKKQFQKKPENLIPSDKITTIISDILLIENAINGLPPDSCRIRMMNIYYLDLFTRYNITKEQFQKSMDYYLSNEGNALKMFKAVEMELNDIKNEYFEDDEMDDEKRITIIS